LGGVRIDLTPQAMGVVATGKPAAVAVSSIAPGSGATNYTGSPECSSTQAQIAREVDICCDFPILSDCHGTISDGIGPYTTSADCGVHLAGSPRLQYTLTFEEFETEAEVDFLYVYAGASADSPLLGAFTGKALPPSLTSSGPDLYLHFTSNDNGQAVGFRATLACIGTPLEYWKPATVATELSLGVPTEKTTLQSQQTAYLSDVMLSVQCCADAELSCANARVTGIGSGFAAGLPQVFRWTPGYAIIVMPRVCGKFGDAPRRAYGRIGIAIAWPTACMASGADSLVDRSTRARSCDLAG
jgi:hypothetical protein